MVDVAHIGTSLFIHCSCSGIHCARIMSYYYCTYFAQCRLCIIMYILWIIFAFIHWIHSVLAPLYIGHYVLGVSVCYLHCMAFIGYNGMYIWPLWYFCLVYTLLLFRYMLYNVIMTRDIHIHNGLMYFANNIVYTLYNCYPYVLILSLTD